MKKLLLLALVISATVFASAGSALAAIDPVTHCETTPPESATLNTKPEKGPTVEPVQRQQCDEAINGTDCTSTTGLDEHNCTLIGSYIQPAVDLFSILFGVAVVAAIIIGGIQYSSSGGDPSKAASGKNHIRNALIALVVYVFFLALLKFMIPGSVF